MILSAPKKGKDYSVLRSNQGVLRIALTAEILRATNLPLIRLSVLEV